MLLTDIQAVFDARNCDRISSEELVEQLHRCEDRPWPEFSKSGKPISKAQLARLLGRYRISPGTIRLADGRTPKGYQRKDFEHAFERYV